MPKSIRFSLTLLLLTLTSELTLQCLENEREALLSVKQHCDTHGTLNSWMGEDCCKWKGIRCNNHSIHVVELDVSGKLLLGSLPTTLERLSALQILRLSYNRFSGLIPMWLSKLSNLTELDLSNNLLHGSVPTSLGDLSTLEVLSLVGNELSGLIPEWLDKLSNLTKLDLSYNLFHGPIPLLLAEFHNLKKLDLSGNNLNGVVPESLGNLSELTELRLDDNSLDGVLSEVHFAKLRKLTVLSLSSNSPTLNISHGWIPPFQLTHIYLRDSNVGPQFPQWLQTQTTIDILVMSNASISDSIPNWFVNFSRSISTINLSGNKIYGKIPRLIPTSMIDNIYLGGNLLEGPLPEFPVNLKRLDLSDNRIGGPLPENIVDLFPKIDSLDLSKNHINGSIPISICKMHSLSFLYLSKNHLLGEIPHCLGRLQGLRVLELSVNNLSGRIPRSIGELLSLERLHLGNNNFTGELPLTLRNCTWLSILDLGKNSLTGRIPTWIGENLVSLNILNLRSNKYTGMIPQSLCYLNDLQILDVAGNNLTGNVPRCFGNFSTMVLNDYPNYFNMSVNFPTVTQVIKGREDVYSHILPLVINLDLSDNNFIGHIPIEITTLHALTSLNLSRNRLTGNIPKEIGQLRSLESLDLAENQLSGPIPESISSISGLGVLNLSYNNLSGRIPKGTQIESLGDQDPTIYAGNHLLCGSPVKRKCPGDEALQSPTYPDTNTGGGGYDLVGRWFYIGLSSGFAVGFCGVCGFFLLNINLRLFAILSRH